MQKIFSIGLLLTATGFAATAHAQLSGSVGLVSLYKTRGVDQEDRNKNFAPAVQASVRYDWSNGLYASSWNSSGRFGRGRLEMDVAGGYAGAFANGLAYDVGYVHYIYPNEGAWNSGDLYGGLSLHGASFYVYWGMRENVNRDDIYYQFTYKRPLMERLSWTAALGYIDFGAAGLRSRFDASLGLEYQLQEKLVMTFQVQGANRSADASHGERNTRAIVGIRMDF